VDRFKGQARDRYLNGAELERFSQALDEMVTEDDLRLEVAAAIRLLLLTAARLNEALTIRWEWIDLDRRVINLPDSKTGKKPLFLSEAAVEVILSLQTARRGSESPLLLPGRLKGKSLNNLSKLWRWVCERVGLSAFDFTTYVT